MVNRCAIHEFEKMSCCLAARKRKCLRLLFARPPRNTLSMRGLDYVNCRCCRENLKATHGGALGKC